MVTVSLLKKRNGICVTKSRTYAHCSATRRGSKEIMRDWVYLELKWKDEKAKRFSQDKKVPKWKEGNKPIL